MWGGSRKSPIKRCVCGEELLRLKCDGLWTRVRMGMGEYKYIHGSSKVKGLKNGAVNLIDSTSLHAAEVVTMNVYL